MIDSAAAALWKSALEMAGPSPLLQEWSRLRPPWEIHRACQGASCARYEFCSAHAPVNVCQLELSLLRKKGSR